LAGIARAVVEIKGWHTRTFGVLELEGAPKIFRFVQPRAMRPVAEAFGQEGPLTKILVLPALPADKEAQLQSLEVVRRKGVDAVLPFQTVLWDLVERVEVNRNYQKSDLLQVIRILKKYEFFRDRQLELFRAKRRRPPGVRKGG